MRHSVRTGVVLALLLTTRYLGVCAAMFLNQASFVYFPERAYDASPADLGMPFEGLRLRAADGTEIAAWWIPSPEALGAVVLAHGNGGNMSHRPAGGGATRLTRLASCTTSAGRSSSSKPPPAPSASWISEGATTEAASSPAPMPSGNSGSSSAG